MTEFDDLARLVTFRPLEHREGDRFWKSSPFSAGWTATVGLLGHELHAVGAKGTVLQVDIREQDLRLDGLPRASASALSPEVVLSFQAMRVPGKPQLSYRVATFDRWRDNVRAIALGLEALRAVDRYGVTRRGEQYAGWKQLEAGGPGDGNPARGRELIAAAGGSVKRALALAHPDHGGDADDFRDVIAARDNGRARA